MIVIVAYAQSPLSQVKNITVKGNAIYSSSELIRKTGLSKNTNIWKVKTKEITSNLNELTEIKKADVSIHWPNTIAIQVQEHKRIAFLEKDATFYPVLENGKIPKNRKLVEIPENSPILFEFKEGAVLNEMVSELNKLPSEILNSISEIHYTPKKTDQFHISLFMNDGFEVSATLRSFADKMVHYPSIISQLDPNKKGIIDLEVGSFFKAFEPEVEENQVEKAKGQG
jgi:cell division protein FtsQ